MTLREVQHLSMKAWPYRRECRGHDPAKKIICCTDAACSVGKVHLHTVFCQRQCAVHRTCERHKGTGKKTQAVAGINSSIQIAGILGFRATQRRSQGDHAGTGGPWKPGQKTRTGRGSWQVLWLINRSCLPTKFSISSFFAENPSHCSWTSSINPSRCSECGSAAAASTHHEVTKYLNVDLLLFFKCITLLIHAVRNCGAAASFVIVVSF